MADEDRAASPELTLGSNESDFFELVRRIERLRAGSPPIGEALRPKDEPVRFVQEPSLAFPTSTVKSVTPPPPAAEGAEPMPIRVAVEFMGLLGPSGPMPLHVTAYARDRIRNHADHTLARFLDVFHHRLVSLFYRAWAAAQQCVQFERADAGPGRPQADRFSRYAGSLCGVGMPAMRGRDALPDVARLHFAGLLAGFTRHPSGFEQFCATYFGVHARVDEFVGEWRDIPDESRCRLGRSRSTGVLGSTCIVGARIWDCQQRFRVTLGPMDLPDYERLLPGGRSFRRLRAWVRQYIGFELGCQVRLILRAGAVPRSTLGSYGRLGWTTWLGSGNRVGDAGDLLIDAS